MFLPQITTIGQQTHPLIMSLKLFVSKILTVFTRSVNPGIIFMTISMLSLMAVVLLVLKSLAEKPEGGDGSPTEEELEDWKFENHHPEEREKLLTIKQEAKPEATGDFGPELKNEEIDEEQADEEPKIIAKDHVSPPESTGVIML
uniref:Suppressor of Mek1 n=1 Tax=Lygus hesperus TaxID=30085 RepID=A0A0A9YQV3_LYGHE